MIPTIPVLSPEQSEAWDRRAEQAGIARATLMSAAGRAVVAVLAERFPAAAARGVLVATGLGNNGGDGWVAARALHRAGFPLWVASLPGERSELCAAAASLALADGVREVPADGPWPAIGLAVDALLGTGARGAPRPAVASLLERLADLRVPIVAVDGPTGLDLASGVVHGAAGAQLTITFGGLRRGHLLSRDEVGDVIVVDVGHPLPAGDWPTLLTDGVAGAQLPRFHADFHKGDRGRVVIVGGAPAMVGAARMVARAAFGAGAGLVHVAAPAETLAVLRTAEPDVQTLEQDFASPPSAPLLELLAAGSVLVVGPGLGREPGRRALVAALLPHARAAVVDADAIVAFQGQADALAPITAGRPIVLTPHPGEFRALVPDLAATAEIDPWTAASAASERLGCVMLLKGVPTVVAAPGRSTLTVAAGNPGLATGGSGDVLSGVIATLLAQRLDPILAAAVGAQILGRAADIAARRHTPRAMRPTDVVTAFADLWRQWALLRDVPPIARPPILLELLAPQRS